MVSSPLSFLLDLRGSHPNRFSRSHDRERRGETAPPLTPPRPPFARGRVCEATFHPHANSPPKKQRAAGWRGGYGGGARPRRGKSVHERLYVPPDVQESERRAREAERAQREMAGATFRPLRAKTFAALAPAVKPITGEVRRDVAT